MAVVLGYLLCLLHKRMMLLCAMQANPQLQVVLCASEPIEIPGVECVTYELEDLGVDNVAQILTSLAPQVLLSSSCYLLHHHHLALNSS